MAELTCLVLSVVILMLVVQQRGARDRGRRKTNSHQCGVGENDRFP